MLFRGQVAMQAASLTAFLLHQGAVVPPDHSSSIPYKLWLHGCSMCNPLSLLTHHTGPCTRHMQLLQQDTGKVEIAVMLPHGQKNM